jgi:putative endonuclease
VKEHNYCVYIVGSRTGTLYIGMTNNLYRRVLDHKSGEFEGFASKYGCNRLVYFESFDDVRKAIDREKQLKGWRRQKKIALLKHSTHAGRIWQRNGEHKWYLPGNRSSTDDTASF